MTDLSHKFSPSYLASDCNDIERKKKKKSINKNMNLHISRLGVLLLAIATRPLPLFGKNLKGAARQRAEAANMAGPVDDDGVASRHLATCGGGRRGDGICSNGQCCSEFGWCGTTDEHCSGGGQPCGNGSRGNGICADSNECCSKWGWCGTSSDHCKNPPSPTPGPPSGTCGNGSRGNGICADSNECCSKWGWCGTSSDHCAPVGPPTPPTGTGGSAKTLTVSDVQAALDAYNRLQGASTVATQSLVNQINSATIQYSLYRQLAFVTHTIWETGGYRYMEEQAAVLPPYANRAEYQDCDWNQGGIQYPANGKYFYGRGYIQLSWCANYKAYGAARMVNGDPEYFYNNPEAVAGAYAMDSAAWFFETMVKDDTGLFGSTTNDINGGQECGPGAPNQDAAPKRYEIFDALAKRVGLSGYSSGGC